MTRTTTAKGRDWMKELDKFLVYYRISPHCITEKLPAKLLFERELKTKLPEINVSETENGEYLRTQKYDTAAKQKIKKIAGKRRHAKEHDIQVWDIVLVEQPKQNKLTTRFNNELWRLWKSREMRVERLSRIKRNTKQHYNYQEVSDIIELTYVHVEQNDKELLDYNMENDDNRGQNKHINMHSRIEDESRQLANGRMTETKDRPQRERRKPALYRDYQFVTNIEFRGKSSLYSDTDEETYIRKQEKDIMYSHIYNYR
ncbi:hypothetical protein GJ496_005244 [Pomphorhynchus laevis]|nr:hypothetical protein GJ496_005244 [Pomphorhynchus laevis]